MKEIMQIKNLTLYSLAPCIVEARSKNKMFSYKTLAKDLAEG